MHRIKYTKLTPDQIVSKLAAADGPASASPLSDVTENGVFEHAYVRRDGRWKIQRSSYRPIED
jgi:hypothetical protein